MPRHRARRTLVARLTRRSEHDHRRHDGRLRQRQDDGRRRRWQGARGGGWWRATSFHPPANVAKMQSGMPLTDEDRWPWLQAIAHEIDAIRARGESAVVASSALKRAYRDILIGDRSDVVLVYLQGLEGSDRRAHGGTQGTFHAAGAAGQPVRHAGGARRGRTSDRGLDRAAAGCDRRRGGEATEGAHG